jgi:(+)-trans-carveol dehydrogenase
MGRLDGKVAFITGIARGQGRSHAIRLAQEGADIIGVDIAAPVATMTYPMGTKDELAETVRLVEATDRRIIATQADVRDLEALKDAVKAGVSELGRLDIVAASAAVSPPGGPIWKIPPEQWNDVIGINLTGVYHTIVATVPTLIEQRSGGAITITSSGAALNNAPNLGDYVATKHGVIGLAMALANELAHRDIRVNVIAPGTVDTPMVTQNVGQFKTFRPDLENPTIEDCMDMFTRINPMRRPWIDPVDISNALVFLSSDEARFITGVILPVDQGNQNGI